MAEKSGSSWREIRANIDLLMLFATIALFLLGISAIYSASPNKAFTLSSFAVRQLMWGGISAVIYVMILRIGYERFLDLAGPLFALIDGRFDPAIGSRLHFKGISELVQPWLHANSALRNR